MRVNSNYWEVSTHSRPKAAERMLTSLPAITRFNTQPPEGGCYMGIITAASIAGFNTQPPEGGCNIAAMRLHISMFQHTAARRRLDGLVKEFRLSNGFNTQPPEGGWLYPLRGLPGIPSFNTQPPEGG